MTPGVSYLMIPVIIFSVVSPILLFIHYWTLYSSKIEEKKDDIHVPIDQINPSHQEPSNGINKELIL